jgi:ABC-type polysaccharide/polyol phosphate export permease
MEDNNNTESRNVSYRDLIAAVIVVALLLFVGWYETLGEKWAQLVFAAIPIVGFIAWLRIPKEKRIEAEENSNREFNKSVIGRAWNYFTWALMVLSIVLIISSLLGNQ